jgi:hypothetical protein
MIRGHEMASIKLNKRIKSISKFNIFVILIIIIYLALGLILLNHYQYIIGADGMSYINIARLYLIGDYSDAINGYWGPLYSLLLIPFLKIFGTSPVQALYANKILNLIIGLFTLVGIILLSSKFELNNLLKYVVIIIMIPFILYVALVEVQSDLLFTGLLVLYFYFIFDNNYSHKLSNGLFCGIIGILLFLTKAYGFPFFIASFILFNILHYIRNFSSKEKKMVIKNFLLAFTIFFVISGLWIAIISDKYGEFTYSTSSEYNYGVVGPDSIGHPTGSFEVGFIKPPYSKAISAWEDPSYFKFKSWNPLESYNLFIFEKKKANTNLNYLISVYSMFSSFIIIIILSYLIILMCNLRDVIQRIHILYPFITILVFPVGYLLVALEVRYLWICYILFVLMGSYILKLFFKNKFFTNTRKLLLITVFIISFMIFPVSNLLTYYDGGQDHLEFSQEIQGNYNISGNIASNGGSIQNYSNSIDLSYYLGTSYYGFSKNNISDEELVSDLKKFGINYYLVWGNSNQTQILSKNFREISNGSISNLKIFAIQ